MATSLGYRKRTVTFSGKFVNVSDIKLTGIGEHKHFEDFTNVTIALAFSCYLECKPLIDEMPTIFSSARLERDQSLKEWFDKIKSVEDALKEHYLHILTICGESMDRDAAVLEEMRRQCLPIYHQCLKACYDNILARANAIKPTGKDKARVLALCTMLKRIIFLASGSADRLYEKYKRRYPNIEKVIIAPLLEKALKNINEVLSFLHCYIIGTNEELELGKDEVQLHVALHTAFLNRELYRDACKALNIEA